MSTKRSAAQIVEETKARARKSARVALLSSLSGSISALDTQRDPSTEEEVVALCEAYLSLYREDMERQAPGYADDRRE